MSIEPLRAIILRARLAAELSQEDAAEAAEISKDEWANLEMKGNTRRTSIRVPADMPMMNRVARVLGRGSGKALLKEAKLL